MNWNRRDFLKAALLLPAGAYLAKFQALAAPHAGMVKITAIKTLGLDNVGDGCLIRIETDAGLVGYGESGVTREDGASPHREYSRGAPRAGPAGDRASLPLDDRPTASVHG